VCVSVCLSRHSKITFLLTHTLGCTLNCVLGVFVILASASLAPAQVTEDAQRTIMLPPLFTFPSANETHSLSPNWNLFLNFSPFAFATRLISFSFAAALSPLSFSAPLSAHAHTRSRQMPMMTAFCVCCSGVFNQSLLQLICVLTAPAAY